MPARPATAPTYRLRFLHLDREIDCAGDETIFHAARRHGVRIVGACGGRGACGSCMVRAHEGKLTDDAGVEIEGGRVELAWIVWIGSDPDALCGEPPGRGDGKLRGDLRCGLRHGLRLPLHLWVRKG